ncbi:MAG: hypothetical protein K9G76_11590 [Bacteroidales bacterium]|nr:hypothetical protein [Bacteroidales bacterium]MCF8405109.1 hypothetical protein [Bacteroidales bacterium]
MRLIAINVILILLSSSLISCGQNSQKQNEIKLNDNELGLIISKRKRYVLESGEHKLEEESKLIRFKKVDSLMVPEFEIIDFNAKNLYCQVQITYSLTPKHIEKIADFLEWVESIESYKKYLIIPEIRSEIRSSTENYKAIELEKVNFKDKAEIEDKVAESLTDYIDLISLELKIFEKIE